MKSRKTQYFAFGTALAFSLAAFVPTASASYWDFHDNDVDVDIESLKANVKNTWNGPAVDIRYKVEVEDANPNRFDVVFTFSQSGQYIYDNYGRLVQIADQLGRPDYIDDDEFVFNNRLSVPLPKCGIHGVKRMKVHMAIFDKITGQIIDDKKEKIKRRWGCDW